MNIKLKIFAMLFIVHGVFSFFGETFKASAREQRTGTWSFVDRHLVGHYGAFSYFVLAPPYNSAVP